MKKLKLILIWILSTVCAAIIAYIVWGYIDSRGGLYNLLIHTQDLLLILLNLTTPLWATIALTAICCLYTYLKIRQYQNSYKPPAIQEELLEEFGVYWNNQYKLRCLKCKWPLKCSSDKKDPSLFFCSNCNLKHSIRDKNGKHLTESQAIEQLKKLPTNHSS